MRLANSSVFLLFLCLAQMIQAQLRLSELEMVSFDLRPVENVNKVNIEFKGFGNKLGLRENIQTLWQDEGLRINKILSLAEDHRRNIWIGGSGELACLTGQRIQHFDIPGFTGDVYGLIEDDERALWIGSFGGGILRFENGKFSRVILPDSTITSDEIAVLDMKLGPANQLYVATARQGVLVFKDGKVNQIGLDDGLLSMTVKAIHFDEDERLWVGYHKEGFSVLDLNFWRHFDNDDGLCHSSVNSIDAGLDGTVIISTRRGASITSFIGDTCQFSNVIDSAAISQSIIDHQNRIWFGTKRDNGCLILEDGKWLKLSESNGMASDRILCMLQTRQHVWTGSFGKGISVCHPSIFSHYNSESGLMSDRPFALCLEEDGQLLVGSHSGLSRISEDGIEPWEHNQRLTKSENYDIYEDSQGNVWISQGSPRQGVHRFDLDGTDRFFDASDARLHWFFDMIEGDNGQMFFGGYGGLVTLVNDTLDFFYLDDAPYSNTIHSFEIDDNKNIWVASESNGCFVLLYNENTLKYSQSPISIPLDSFDAHDHDVQDILIDSSQNIWMSSHGEGVFVFDNISIENFLSGDSEDIAGRLFNTENGLPSNQVTSLIEGESGVVWVGSLFGLASIDTNYERPRIRAYGKESGIVNTQINPNNVLRDLEGNIWWCSETCLMKYNTEMDKADTLSPQLYFSDLTIDFSPIDYSRPEEDSRYRISSAFLRSFFKGYIHFTNLIEDAVMPENPILSHDQNYLLFEFNCPHWERPEELVYESILEGRDENWTPLSTPGSYECLNLNPGDYTLKIRATNADGILSPPISYSFKIQPPLHRTYGFYGLVIILLALGAYIYFRRRYKALEKENIKLENAVLKRTEELSREKKKSDDLLLNILPEFTADELKETGSAKTRSYESASVLFSDFKGFTQLSESVDSENLVRSLDVFFKRFDDLTADYGIEKIKTIGDAYMCASGIPVEDPQHAIRLIAFAMEMVWETEAINLQRVTDGLAPWPIRIGIHSGPLIAGVVGKKKFAFDIWGDTVNTASRMESNGVAGRVNISHATMERVREYLDVDSRGKIDVKGKGEMEMFLVKQFKTGFHRDELAMLPDGNSLGLNESPVQ